MLEESELRKIAAQLGHPSGEEGIEMGKSMQENNIGMVVNAIENLAIRDNDFILELGHATGSHVKQILEKAVNVRYMGLEVSEEMKNMATEINRSYLPFGLASFELYDGNKILCADQTFDHIISVNTIYFWQNPIALLKELCRVLKDGGTCVLTFADKSFMERLPFTKYNFTLYDIDTFNDLVLETDFELVQVKMKREKVFSKTGDEVIRKFYTCVLNK